MRRNRFDWVKSGRKQPPLNKIREVTGGHTPGEFYSRCPECHERYLSHSQDEANRICKKCANPEYAFLCLGCLHIGQIQERICTMNKGVKKFLCPECNDTTLSYFIYNGECGPEYSLKRAQEMKTYYIANTSQYKWARISRQCYPQ